MADGRDLVDEMLAQWAEERPDLDPSGLEAVLRIQLLAGHLAGRLEALLEPGDLAAWEYDVLSALRRAGAVTPTELCRSAQLSSGAMTHRLDRLEERGLLKRRPCHEDGRSTQVELTARGRRLVDGLLGERMGDAREALAALTPGQQRQLARLLRKVAVDLDPEA